VYVNIAFGPIASSRKPFENKSVSSGRLFRLTIYMCILIICIYTIVYTCTRIATYTGCVLMHVHRHSRSPTFSVFHKIIRFFCIPADFGAKRLTIEIKIRPTMRTMRNCSDSTFTTLKKISSFELAVFQIFKKRCDTGKQDR